MFPSHFFNISQTDFPHHSLFGSLIYTWDALKQVAPYLERYFKNHKGLQAGIISPHAIIVNSETVEVGEGSIVEPGAYIQGPCIIGKGCSIRHGAYIRGNVIAGDGCVIGHCTEIKNTLMLPNSKAAHFAYLGDSILGSDVNLGAGVRCANLRLDRKQIKIRTPEGEKIESGLKKFGAIIGDRVQLGCNCVTNPGTIIEPEVCISPVKSVSGWIQKNN